jgi:hypothetical protein
VLAGLPDGFPRSWIDSHVLEVLGDQSCGASLANSAELQDTWGRIILGYDLAALPQASVIDTLRIMGVHIDGPHRGFELHEIRARQ